MGSRENVCPVCGQPVEAVVRRHKTLGVFVPVWRPGPCRNPRCSAYQGQEAEQPAPGTGTEQGSQSGEAEKTDEAPPGEAGQAPSGEAARGTSGEAARGTSAEAGRGSPGGAGPVDPGASAAVTKES